jgi:Superfamily I DNA and RNA helicases
VLVDEFQDVDAAQLRLVNALAAPEDNLFVVGDDDQS